MLAENLRLRPADQHTAGVFYNAVFTATAVFYNLLWQVASRRNRLIVAGAEEAAAGVTDGCTAVPYRARTGVRLAGPDRYPARTGGPERSGRGSARLGTPRQTRCTGGET